VELDPAVIDLLVKYSSEESRTLMKDSRVNLVYEDGREFIRNSRGAYDLIFLNVPDPSTAQLNRYYTQEFYLEVLNALKPKGVFTTSIQASVRATGDEVLTYAKIIYWTLRSIFPVVMVQPGQTYRYYACPVQGQATVDPSVMVYRYQKRKVQPENFAATFETLFQKDLVDPLQDALKTPPLPPLNTDLHPTAYLHQNLLWNKWTGSAPSQLLPKLKDRSPWWMVPIALVILLIRWLRIRKRDAEGRHRFDVALAIAVLGLTSLSIELILMLAFQNAFGLLYHKVALVIALFMFGLTVGSLGTKIYIGHELPSESKLDILFGILMFLSGVFAAVIPALIQYTADSMIYSPMFYYFLVGLAGLMTGAGFPPAVILFHPPDRPVAYTAGVIDAMDHLGAMIGALLAGTFWLPLWGVWTTCSILAVMNLIVFVLLLGKRVLSSRSF